jgi:hypothetical protein
MHCRTLSPAQQTLCACSTQNMAVFTCQWTSCRIPRRRCVHAASEQPGYTTERLSGHHAREQLRPSRQRAPQAQVGMDLICQSCHFVALYLQDEFNYPLGMILMQSWVGSKGVMEVFCYCAGIPLYCAPVRACSNRPPAACTLHTPQTR